MIVAKRKICEIDFDLKDVRHGTGVQRVFRTKLQTKLDATCENIFAVIDGKP